jgi:hypothetical protein
VDLEAVSVRSYVSEPACGRRNWEDHPEARGLSIATAAGSAGREGNRCEANAWNHRLRISARPGARCICEGARNILKRVRLQIGAFNLFLLMRQLIRVGTPRSIKGRGLALLGCFWSLIPDRGRLWDAIWMRYQRSPRQITPHTSQTLSSTSPSHILASRTVRGTKVVRLATGRDVSVR